MFRRLENIVETSQGIVCILKLCFRKYSELLHYIEKTRNSSFFNKAIYQILVNFIWP